MAKNKSPSQKMVLPVGLGSYVWVFGEPRAPKPPMTGKPKWSLALLWDKKEPGLVEIRKVIETLAIQQFGEKVYKQLVAANKFKNPLHDGDLEKPEDKIYAGKVYMNASTTRLPVVVDAHRKPIFEESECYSGCYFRAAVNLFAYDTGGQGVGCGLNALQVVKKGERLAQNVDVDELFGSFEEVGESKPTEDISEIG